MKTFLVSEKKEEEIKYPCLRESIVGSIYLFLNSNYAIIVYACGAHTFGQTTTTISVMNTRPFTGQVVLQND